MVNSCSSIMNNSTASEHCAGVTQTWNNSAKEYILTDGILRYMKRNSILAISNVLSYNGILKRKGNEPRFSGFE